MAAGGQHKTETGDWAMLSWRNHGGSAADWPERWHGPALPWPTESSERWIPEQPGKAATVCVRSSSSGQPMELLEWASLTEAIQAARELFTAGPCGRGCLGHHVVVWTDGVRGVNVKSVPAPKPPSRAEALAACYPHNGYPVSLERWARPPEFNAPLPPRGVPCPPMTQRTTSASS